MPSDSPVDSPSDSTVDSPVDSSSDSPVDSPVAPEEHVTPDTKARFREALERKRASDGVAGPQVRADGKVAGPHDSEQASSQQNLRRKSGM